MEDISAAAPSKRPRPDDDDVEESQDEARKRLRGTFSTAIVPVAQASSSALIVPSTNGDLPTRTSTLDAPIMLLEGHGAAITGLNFHPNGRVLATSSKDKTVFLWNVDGACTNTAVLRGHKNAVLDLAFLLSGDQLCTASADRFVGVWDTETGSRLRKLAGHSKIVNAISCAKKGPPLLVSGSDDGTVIMWDARKRGPVHTFRAEAGAGGTGYPVLSVAFGGDESDCVFSAGVDNVIRQWDVRRGSRTASGQFSTSPSLSLSGHTDSVTGLALHPHGTHLLSFSSDHSVRAWDVRPFCASPSRCTALFTGATQNFEQSLIRPAWSSDGERVACGSADRRVWVWDYESGAVEYALPGHAGVVTAVAFSPTDPAVLASAGADRKVYIGELSRANVPGEGEGAGRAGSAPSTEMQDEL